MNNSTLFGELKDIAIDRLREFESVALSKHPDGFYLAYSGGKDSDVILNLIRQAGVKYTAHHNLTTCDPPELIRHVKEQPDVIIHKPKMTMWQLIRKKGMAPRRNARYCCEMLKETAGGGRLIVTGVRWKESSRRSKRRMVEACYRDKSKHYLHPIIDWENNDVWDYIHSEKIDYCKLYDEGFKRLGCVLCPMANKQMVAKEMERWPKIALAWEKAIKSTWKPNEDKKFPFKSAEDYWQWWLDRDRPAMNKDKTIMMFED